MSKKNPNFEENLIRLEQIVQAMEKGDVSLEDSLKLFQEGTDLVKKCAKRLDEAQQQVTKIMAEADGTFREEAFLDADSV